MSEEKNKIYQMFAPLLTAMQPKWKKLLTSLDNDSG